jgi:hypothetical protein
MISTSFGLLFYLKKRLGDPRIDLPVKVSFRKFLFMIFFVQYAFARRHPLCISRINYATIACAVTRCTTLTL